MSKAFTFYWHDYETFGANPARDRPSQFAGVRTDADLNIIGEPLVVYCKPANDFLPQPQACLITGITPQKALADGLPECEFIEKIHAELSQPGTCGVGFNSLRFDDEVTRHTLYRNFFDPYAREWQHGNSRWDIIDMLRTARALRPEGIEWPQRPDGCTSFRLEELTQANGIAHEAAHDALSDVYATIAMARLLRDKQPRLYDFLLTHRDKRKVATLLDVATLKPVLHVSGMFGAQRNNIALVAPLARHPTNRNEVICFDLEADPAPLFEHGPDELQQWLFARTADLPEGTERLGLKSVHVNRCPVVLPAKMADAATAQRLGLDTALARAHLDELQAHVAGQPGKLDQKLQQIYTRKEDRRTRDPDLMLYSGGFFSNADRGAMEQVRSTPPEMLAETSFVFSDARLPEMLFRYRARNYLHTLNRQERAQWEEYRYARLTEPDGGGSPCLEAFHEEVDELLAQPQLSAEQARILHDLQDYSDTLLAA